VVRSNQAFIEKPCAIDEKVSAAHHVHGRLVRMRPTPRTKPSQN
jgi:hypothetical protein